jgi:hypothetical protein
MTAEIIDHKFPEIVALVGPQGPSGSGVDAAIGPASAIDSTHAVFDGTSGKLLKAGRTVEDMWGNVGIGTVPRSHGDLIYLEVGGTLQTASAPNGSEGQIRIRNKFGAVTGEFGSFEAGALLALVGGSNTLLLTSSSDGGNQFAYYGVELAFTGDDGATTNMRLSIAGNLGLGGTAVDDAGIATLAVGGTDRGGTLGKFLVRNASGVLRGQLSAGPDGAGLLLGGDTVFMALGSYDGFGNVLDLSGAALKITRDDGSAELGELGLDGRLKLPAIEATGSGFTFPDGSVQATAGITPNRFDVASPAGTWIILHNLGRVPGVQLFDPAGNAIISDVVADAVHITVTFGLPQAGFLLAF